MELWEGNKYNEDEEEDGSEIRVDEQNSAEFLQPGKEL